MSTPEFWLETERLRLRRFTMADLDWFVALYGDPEVTRHLGGLKTPAQATELLQSRIIDYYDANPGMGIWLTVERATAERVGLDLLNHILGETLIQVGFVLATSAWGKGYGTEMAGAVLRHGYVELRLPRIVAIANLGNLASQRVLTKIG